MIRFNLLQLEAFYWVAQLGSFRAAADHLRLSQPTITVRIKKLEDSIETALLDRSGYRPRLTTAGHAVLRHSQEALEVVGRIQGFSKNGQFGNPLLRLGVVDFTVMTNLPEVLNVFEDEFPDLKLDLTINYSSRLQSLLFEDELDMAVLTEAALLKGIQFIPLGDIPLSWMASPKYDVPSGRLTPKDLVQFRIVTNPPPSNLYNSIVNWFGQEGLVPKQLLTCNSMYGLRKLVSSGYAISVLPSEILKNPGGGNKLREIPVTPAPQPHRACLAYRLENEMPALRAVLQSLTKLLAKA